MTREDVLYLFEKYKDRPFEIDLGDSAACMRGNIEGHWLFLKGDGVVEVKKNTTDGSYDVMNTHQSQAPFKVTYCSFDSIAYIRSFITSKPGDVEKQISDFTPVGTSKSKDEIITEITSDSIYNAASARGYLDNENTAPGTMYGKFRGSILSTDINGVPNNVKNAIMKE